ncbi:MAG: type II toxin-antitoxin system HicB family antitoxin [Acidobacteria bacterium]|nr:type II toxin-antitoxin system HicB family antitoxin [Acidobacteriota bacterium]
MNKYSFKIVWSDEDEAYIVTCHEFPGLSAFGDTQESALAEAQTALNLMIETYKGSGIELPQPKVEEEFSGQSSKKANLLPAAVTTSHLGPASGGVRVPDSGETASGNSSQRPVR